MTPQKIPFVMNPDGMDDVSELAPPSPSGYPDQDPAPQAGAAAPLPRIGDDTPLGRFAQPILPAPPPMPQVTTVPQAHRDEERQHVQDDLAQLNKPHLGQPGSSMPGTFGKILHGVGQVAGTAANILAPATMMIRGTPLNDKFRRIQDNRELGELDKEDQDATTQHAENAKTAAATTNLDLQPQLKAAQAGLANNKYVAQLAEHGFAPDETSPGQLRPLRYEEMSETQQAAHDLKGAQQEQAEATAALRAAQNDPSSPGFKLAQGRLAVAQKNAETALQRLGLSGAQFELKSQGTVHGEAPAGAMLTEDGRPVGTAFQSNVRPTGTQRTKADMANSAEEQLTDIKDIMQKHPELFGPGYGQASAFRQWMGSQDPDAQRFQAARTIAADHLAGTFGGRSEGALKALDDAIGQYKDNPTAAIAGIDQLTKANTRFEKAGTVKTVGSSAGGHGATPEPKVFTDGGVTYHIPPDQVADFKKDHPHAR